MTFVRCKLCCIPTTRPDTAFVDSICSACINHANRPAIGWKARKAELVSLLEASSKNGSDYACIVPSSGGKDSVYQALKVIELGFRPLVVTASTCMLTDVGRKNIDNLARYATTVEFTPNRTIRAKLNRLGLDLVGDVSWPEHVSIFTTPFRAAVSFGIPTILYGENPQACYGGPIGTEEAREMTVRWRSEFGGFLGLRPADLIGMDGITEADMADYVLPSEDQLQNVTALWLGQFELWDSARNARVAKESGMIQQLPSPANWWVAENQDCVLTGLHDHGMYRKFGLGRLSAQISVDIRNGKISRQEALQIVEDRDGLFPEVYMGVPLDDVLDHLGMTHKQLMAALDKHTNWELFAHVHGSRPILKEFAECLLLAE